MKLLPAEAVNCKFYKDENWPYWLCIGEYRNHLKLNVVSFLKPRLNMSRFQVVSIPKIYKPSTELCVEIAAALGLGDCLPLAVPNGMYYGDHFHTLKGTMLDPYLFAGDKVAECLVAPGVSYDIVAGIMDNQLCVFVGVQCGHNGEQYLWSPASNPVGDKERNILLDHLYGQADKMKASIIMPTHMTRH